MNLLTILSDSFGLSREQIEQGIVLRADKVYADTYFIDDWMRDESLIPQWASRAAASWVIELWLSERDNCDATSLLKVDEKYTRYLRDFSLGEIIAMRNALIRSNQST